MDRSQDVLEGRLIAQRKILGRLVAVLAAQDRDLIDWLAERAVLHDGQEDPGGVEGPGVAEALATADEFRLVLEAAQAAATPRR